MSRNDQTHPSSGLHCTDQGAQAAWVCASCVKLLSCRRSTGDAVTGSIREADVKLSSLRDKVEAQRATSAEADRVRSQAFEQACSNVLLPDWLAEEETCGLHILPPNSNKFITETDAFSVQKQAYADSSCSMPMSRLSASQRPCLQGSCMEYEDILQGNNQQRHPSGVYCGQGCSKSS